MADPRAPAASRGRPVGAVLIIGLGDDCRRDDGAGRVVARALRARALPSVTVRESRGEATALMGLWADAGTVWLVDAVSSGSPPGRLQVLDLGQQPCARELFCCSSHAFGVGEAVELARALGQLPPDLRLYAIEGQDFAPGLGLTPDVARGAEQAVRRICEELQGGLQPCTKCP